MQEETLPHLTALIAPKSQEASKHKRKHTLLSQKTIINTCDSNFLRSELYVNILTHQWYGDFNANLRHFTNNRDEIVNNKIAFTPSSCSSFKIYAFAVSSAGQVKENGGELSSSYNHHS
jgi:hypothetical protein